MKREMSFPLYVVLTFFVPAILVGLLLYSIVSGISLYEGLQFGMAFAFVFSVILVRRVY